MGTPNIHKVEPLLLVSQTPEEKGSTSATPTPGSLLGTANQDPAWVFRDLLFHNSLDSQSTLFATAALLLHFFDENECQLEAC